MQKYTKNHHLCTITQFVGLCLHNYGMHRQSEKKLVKQLNICSTCPNNMENFGPLAAEIDCRVWGTPASFNGLCYCTDVAQLRSTKLSTMFGHFLGWLLPPNGILPLAKFTLHPYLAFSCTRSITARHSSSVCQSDCGVQQRVPPIFGTAAVTFGIGPHCSFVCSFNFFLSFKIQLQSKKILSVSIAQGAPCRLAP